MSDQDEKRDEELSWMGQYTLGESGEPVRERNLLRWAKWLATADRCVANDQVGEARVSTIFLGLDMHLLRGDPHAPLLWETMVFGGPYDRHQQRYTSREEALDGHKKIVQMLTS